MSSTMLSSMLGRRSAMKGDAVILLGSDSPWDGAAGIAGSEALAEFYGFNVGLPAIDLDLEVRVQKLCRFLISTARSIPRTMCRTAGSQSRLANRRYRATSAWLSSIRIRSSVRIGWPLCSEKANRGSLSRLMPSKVEKIL